MQSYMLHSICAWKSDIPISQLKLLTGTPPEVRVPTLKLGGAATNLDFKIQNGYSVHQQQVKLK